MEHPEQVKMFLDFFNYIDLNDIEQQRVHGILHGQLSSEKEPQLPWSVVQEKEVEHVAKEEQAQIQAVPDVPAPAQVVTFNQSAAGDPGMNMRPPMPPPNMVHPGGYGPDMVINTNAPHTEAGMFSPPGMPSFQTVVDPSTGNLIQIFAYQPPYMVGMPPHGAAGPPCTEGYMPMMGNMGPHGMGAHGAPPMPMHNAPVSYGMGIPPQDHNVMAYNMNQMASDIKQGLPQQHQQQQQRERRNKKKRPADYYKKLEERERLAQEPRDPRMDQFPSLNARSASHSMPGKVHGNMPMFMSAPQQVGPPMHTEQVYSFPQMMPQGAMVYPSQMNVGIPAQQHMQNSNDSVSYVPNMGPTHMEETDKNNSAIGALPQDNSAQTFEPANSKIIQTQAKPPDKPVQSTPPAPNTGKGATPITEEFGFSISFGSVDESHLGKMKSMSQLTSDESAAKNVSDDCDTNAISDSKEATAPIIASAASPNQKKDTSNSEKQISKVEKTPSCEKQTPRVENTSSSEKQMPRVEKTASVEKQMPRVEKTASGEKQMPRVEKPPNSDKPAAIVEKTPDKDSGSNVETKDSLPQATPENQAPASSAAPVPDKPKSWASLLHGTSTANSATVVYDTVKSASSKAGDSKDGKKKESSPSPDAVVAASDDKNARQLGELLKDYKAKYVPVSLLPRGLHNSNNWCYINATLQALLACPAFYHLMKALPAFPPLTRGPSSTPVIDALSEFFNEFEEKPIQKLDGKALNAKGTVKQDIPVGSVFTPKCIFRMLNMIKDDSQFKLGKQEDAEEFLSCILNLLHEEMVAAGKIIDDDKKDDENASTNGDCPLDDATKADEDDEEEDGQWEQVGPKNKSVITRTAEFERSAVSEIFRGQIRSIVHKPGAKESATLQPFFTLQLDIQNEAVWSVKDALDGFVSKETISDHKYIVRGMEVNATRRIVLEDLPRVLILHLKCFVYDKSGGSQKITKEVEFDTEMDLNKDLLSPTARSKFGPLQRKYKLFAVVNHIGSRAIGGHYTADVYHPGICGWLRCDDNFINSISANSVTKFHSPKVPYLLYYRRMDLT